MKRFSVVLMLVLLAVGVLATAAAVGNDGAEHAAATLVDTAGNVVGSAIVIHVNEDDQVTDPTGNSSGRVACGVIE